MKKNLVFFLSIILIIQLSLLCKLLQAQRILLDDLNSMALDTNWAHYIDSLEVRGVSVFLTTEGYWDSLMSMDVLWITHSRGHIPIQIEDITMFSREGGNILMFTLSDTFSPNNNSLLNDTLWRSTISVAGQRCTNPVGCKMFFPPFTGNIERIIYPDSAFFELAGPPSIDCGIHAYPFFFCDDIDYKPVVAISYPFYHEDNCNSFIAIITGTSWLEIYYIWQENQYKIGLNLLFSCLGLPGYELERCAVPEPFIIQVDSCPNCANPGDTITLTGNNLWQGSNENIGGDIEIYIGDTVVIPIEYSDYAPNCSTLTNTWLKFICPELPAESYFIQLGHKAILFDAGEIQIPCEADYEPNTCMAHPLPFSPNNDGINDYCKFEYPGMSENNGIVSIFNLDNTLVREVRNGDVQYSSKGTIYWDGKDSEGNVVNNGVYIYLVKVGSKIVCNGTVYVVK